MLGQLGRTVPGLFTGMRSHLRPLAPYSTPMLRPIKISNFSKYACTDFPKIIGNKMLTDRVDPILSKFDKAKKIFLGDSKKQSVANLASELSIVFGYLLSKTGVKNVKFSANTKLEIGALGELTCHRLHACVSVGEDIYDPTAGQFTRGDSHIVFAYKQSEIVEKMHEHLELSRINRFEIEQTWKAPTYLREDPIQQFSEYMKPGAFIPHDGMSSPGLGYNFSRDLLLRLQEALS